MSIQTARARNKKEKENDVAIVDLALVTQYEKVCLEVALESGQ